MVLQEVEVKDCWTLLCATFMIWNEALKRLATKLLFPKKELDYSTSKFSKLDWLELNPSQLGTGEGLEHADWKINLLHALSLLRSSFNISAERPKYTRSARLRQPCLATKGVDACD